MPFVLTTDTNPGTAEWTEGTVPVAETELVVGSVPTTIVAPTNALSDNNNFLAGNAATGVTASNAGTYILTVAFLVQSTTTS